MSCKNKKENSKSIPEAKDLSVVIATDCGSTTTKAILFEKTETGWRQTYRGEAPTTVEKPVQDVTIGARNAFREIQELSGRKILLDSSSDSSPLIQRTPENPDEGVDIYVSTSSAGGGLQMVVAGVVDSMTTESAERAALGAGAIVMDAISIDDGRETYERVDKIRHLRPDIILIAGGTNGGTLNHPLELAETVLQADPRPRFGETLRLPVIFAANEDAREQAKDILEGKFAFEAVENLRPTLEDENLGPARDAIHEIFLLHVMSHAPGYDKLIGWSPVPIIPTPAGVGDMVQAAAKRNNIQILAVDIGGATTDVFSVFRSGSENDPDSTAFNRTVSANLGMSYSVANVLLEAGVNNIRRWLPFPLGREEIQDRARNKMIRPTSIPQTVEDLLLEQSVCREALRLAFIHHKRLAVGLSGGKEKKGIADFFAKGSESSLVNMMGLDLIIGSGGVLSHAPDRRSTAFMMLDAYQPEGVTRLAVDSIFMMPHLGVLSTVSAEAASEIFINDCLINLGTAVAPTGKFKLGEEILKVEGSGIQTLKMKGGELRRLDLPEGQSLELKLTPLRKKIDVGEGPGNERVCIVHGGHAGIIIDCRGRPVIFPDDWRDAVSLQQKWYDIFGLERPQ